MHQPTSTKQGCVHYSKQSSLLLSLIPHARLPQPSSSRQVSPLEALGCWWTVTTVSACLFFSLGIRFQSRHDRRSATGFNPGQEEQRQQTTNHVTWSFFMAACCHEQQHGALMTNTTNPWGQLAILWDRRWSHLFSVKTCLLSVH